MDKTDFDYAHGAWVGPKGRLAMRTTMEWLSARLERSSMFFKMESSGKGDAAEHRLYIPALRRYWWPTGSLTWMTEVNQLNDDLKSGVDPFLDRRSA